MSDIYPFSMHCRFEDFPARIRVTCGPAFSEARATPYSFGSRVDLVQTPKSGVLAGTLTPGEPLPTLETIYADTGDDDVFDLKLAHYGYGRFYLGSDEAAFYSLAVIKGMRVEATGIRRSFETVDVWNTRVPVETDLSELPDFLGNVVLQDTDPFNRMSVAWFVGDMPAEGIVIRGSRQIEGEAAFQA
jgi:hypothetical protein